MNRNPAPDNARRFPSDKQARISHHRYLRQGVSDLERLERRDDRGRLRTVTLKRLHHQREPPRVGQQPDGDLEFHATFLAVSGFPEPVPDISLSK